MGDESPPPGCVWPNGTSAESAETIWCAPVAEVGEFVARSMKEHDDV